MTTFYENLLLLFCTWIGSYFLIHKYQREKDTLLIREKVISGLTDTFNSVYEFLWTIASFNIEEIDLPKLTHEMLVSLGKFKPVLHTYIDDLDFINNSSAEFEKIIKKATKTMNEKQAYPPTIYKRDLKDLQDLEVVIRRGLLAIIKPFSFKDLIRRKTK